MKEFLVVCDGCKRVMTYEVYNDLDLTRFVRELIGKNWIIGNKDLCPICRNKGGKK